MLFFRGYEERGNRNCAAYNETMPKILYLYTIRVINLNWESVYKLMSVYVIAPLVDATYFG